MTWTYSAAPTEGSVDEVRFLVGDVDTNDQQLQNEEITYLISTYGEGVIAAMWAARHLQAKHTRRADVTVGDVSEAASAIAANYALLAAALESRLSAMSLPTMGGVEKAVVAAAQQDESQVQPAFNRDQFNNPRAASKTDPFDNGGGV